MGFPSAQNHVRRARRFSPPSADPLASMAGAPYKSTASTASSRIPSPSPINCHSLPADLDLLHFL